MALREWLSRFRSRSGPEGELGGGLQGGYAVITEKEKAEVGAPAFLGLWSVLTMLGHVTSEQ